MATGGIYYPTNIAPRVTVMDNAGNEILHFGTYGNRDSMGGLPGDKIPTKGIPLAFPNSVGATDNYIYVADMVNLRLPADEKEIQGGRLVPMTWPDRIAKSPPVARSGLTATT